MKPDVPLESGEAVLIGAEPGDTSLLMLVAATPAAVIFCGDTGSCKWTDR